MVFCLARGCSNDSKRTCISSVSEKRSIGYHRLPKDRKLLAVWLRELGRSESEFDNPRKQCVCSLHFTSLCYRDGPSVRRRLKSTAVPTVFPPKSAKAHEKRRSKVSMKVRGTKRKRQETDEVLKTSNNESLEECRVSNPILQSSSLQVNDKETQCDLINVTPLRLLSPTCTRGTTYNPPDRYMATKMTQWPECKDKQEAMICSSDHCYSRPISVHTIKIVCQTDKDTSDGGDDVDVENDDHDENDSVDDNRDDSDEDSDDGSDENSDDNSDDDSYDDSDVSVEATDPPFSAGEESTSEESDDEMDSSTTRKFLVFEDKLDELLHRCRECGALIIHWKKLTEDSKLLITMTCCNDHQTTWRSQPQVKKMPAGNLALAAAVLLTGNTYSRLKDIAELLHMPIMSEKTFCKIQNQYLFPILFEKWAKEKKDVMRQLKGPGSPLTLCGDGRCDSPGYSAKYCTYTVMDQESHKIIDSELLQVTEVANSNAMEKEGFLRVMDRITKAKLKVKTIATDNHTQITKVMATKKKFKKISHQLDVWHFAKNVAKKLQKKAKAKKRKELAPWIQSVSNHLWWCCATCDGKSELLKDKWVSIIHHVANVHSWTGSDHFHQCSHPALTEDERKGKMWLKVGGAAHDALKEVVMNPKLLDKLPLLTEFCHTSHLESYHSLYLKYCPKRKHFSYEGMKARMILAVLDHNQNTDRIQARTQKGDLRYNSVCPKGRKTWIVKPVPGCKCHKFQNLLMEQLMINPGTGKKMVMRKNIAKNIASVEKPDKKLLIAAHRSRMLFGNSSA